MSISPQARLAIRNVFTEQKYQEWQSKWPGSDLTHFVVKYTTALTNFHRTFPTEDPIPTEDEDTAAAPGTTSPCSAKKH
ncbi:unnamed protein product [Zymoseptoria tritici ST99CH_3D1]|nr:unnamed protein product [Zymoseptoria tritici ST99CH_3D1]